MPERRPEAWPSKFHRKQAAKVIRGPSATELTAHAERGLELLARIFLDVLEQQAQHPQPPAPKERSTQGEPRGQYPEEPRQCAPDNRKEEITMTPRQACQTRPAAAPRLSLHGRMPW